MWQASSQKLRSSFNDLRAAGLKGVTFEQAARDIKLSGDIRQIGESAARIAINDGFSAFNNSKKYFKDIYDDIYYPKTTKERSAFNRSMANKTSDLKDGETRRIIINTADNFYVVEADGHMSGNIEMVLPIDKNTDRIKKIREEITNADKHGKSFDSRIENLRNARRGNNSYNDSDGYGTEAESVAGMDGIKSESNSFRSTDRNGKNHKNIKTRAVKGSAVVAPDVKVTEGMKGDIIEIDYAKTNNLDKTADTSHSFIKKTVGYVLSACEKGMGTAAPKNTLPSNDSQIKHIFREKTGHISDTPDNRKLLENVANKKENYMGIDKYGNEWYSQMQSDGSQVWVTTRNGTIQNGGINNPPKIWNADTGYSGKKGLIV